MAGLRQILKGWAHQLREEWPGVLFVPALIFLLHHTPLISGLVHAIDGYAFLVIGNLAAIADVKNFSPSKREDGVVVALIDHATHEQRYSGRSPLDRCELLEDIDRLYKAGPDVLAIDLDISPASWLRSPDSGAGRELEKGAANSADDHYRRSELKCEEKLYALIKDKNRAKRTVLMTPYRPFDQLHALKKQCAWQADMQRAGVRFGRAELPQGSGMVLQQYKDEASFVAAVGRADSKKKPPARSYKRLIDDYPCDAKQQELSEELERINPLLYGTAVCPVELQITSRERDDAPEEFGDRQVEAFCPKDKRASFEDRLRAALDGTRSRVLFYGAGYGDDDVFLTSVGHLYGVEVQAAAYQSTKEPINERPWLALLGDIVIALLFSLAIGVFWKRYFRGRLSALAWDRQVAALNVLWLMLVFAAVLFLACYVSLWLLGRCHVWLSPVPIGAGMLLDAFVLGSVHVAIHASTEQVHRAVATLRDARPDDFAGEAERALKQHRPESKSYAESLYRFFIGDWFRLFVTNRLATGVVIAFRRLIWLAVVAAAIFFAVVHV